MKAEWLTLAEMEMAITRDPYTNKDGVEVSIQSVVAKEIVSRIAAASKAKAERLKHDPGT